MIDQTRIFFTTEAKIPINITNGTINKWDLIITEDTHKLYIVDDTNTPFVLRSDADDNEELLTDIQYNITTLQNTKQDKETGKGLSTNDYTTTEKNNLATVITELYEAKQDINALQNSSSNYATIIDLNNYVTTNTLSNYVTNDILLNYASKTDLNNYAAKDSLNNYATKNDLSAYITETEVNELISSVTYPIATQTKDGLMSSDDKIKLDGLENIEYDIVTDTKNGLMSAEDKIKLDNLNNIVNNLEAETTTIVENLLTEYGFNEEEG